MELAKASRICFMAIFGSLRNGGLIMLKSILKGPISVFLIAIVGAAIGVFVSVGL